MLFYCGLTKQKGMCAYVHTHTQTKNTLHAGGGGMREWGRSLKEEEKKSKWNPANCRFWKKKKLYVIPQSTTVEVRPPLTHWLIVPVYGPTFFLLLHLFCYSLEKSDADASIHTGDCLTALMFFSLIHSLSAWWWLQRPRRSFFTRSSRPKKILCKRNQNHNVQCIGKD